MVIKTKKAIILFCFSFILLSNTILNALLYKTDHSHVPLVILIDQIKNGKSEESPEDKSLRSLILTFRDLVKQKACSILVTQAILHNFLHRKKNWGDEKHKENEPLKDVVFDSKDWKIYHPEDTQFYLLISDKLKDLSKYFKDELKNKVIETKEGDYFELIEKLDPEKVKTPGIQASDLEKFLKTKPLVPYKKEETEKEALARLQEEEKYPVWDVFISGHGLKDVSICNLSPKVMQDFLMFFNNKVNTGVFIAESCYVGGTNLEFFRFKKGVKDPTTFFSLNYLVVANGIEDTLTYYSLLNFSEIFSIAANLGKDKKHSFQALLLQLNPKKLRENIPQLILPGGIEIQTLYPDENVKIIGKVTARVAQAEDKPIVIQGQLNVLVYPEVIMVPLNVYPNEVGKDKYIKVKKEYSKFLYPVRDFVNKNVWFLRNFVENKREEFPVLSRIDLVANFSGFQPFLLYPFFISMVRNGYTHFFKEMNVFPGEKKLSPGRKILRQGGVLNFIIDAFLNVRKRESHKIFLIESLNGPNDIVLLLEASRAIKQISKKHPLEEVLGEKDTDSDIVLNELIIETRKKYIKFAFKVNNTAWEFSLDEDNVDPKQMLWNFRKINVTDHNSKFQLSKNKLLLFLEKPRKKEIDNKVKIAAQMFLKQILLLDRIFSRSFLKRRGDILSDFPNLSELANQIFSDPESFHPNIENAIRAIIFPKIESKLQVLDRYFKFNNYFGKQEEIKKKLKFLNEQSKDRFEKFKKAWAKIKSAKSGINILLGLLKNDIENCIKEFKTEIPEKLKMLDEMRIISLLNMEDIKKVFEDQIKIIFLPFLFVSFEQNRLLPFSFKVFPENNIFILEQIITEQKEEIWGFDGLIKKINKIILDDLDFETNKIFLVSELETEKDLVLFLESSRVLNAISKKSDLEIEILKEKMPTKLKIFIVKVKGEFSKESNEYNLNFSFAFQLNKTTWRCELDKDTIAKGLWDFEKIDLQKHKVVFEKYLRHQEDMVEQKKMGKVLKEKFFRIRQKKLEEFLERKGKK